MSTDVAALAATAQAIVADGKGVLAADESSPTIKKRFDSIGVESTEATRRSYREILFRTEGLGRFIGGVILFDETLRQDAADGTPLVKVLQDQGIIPGIKVDAGAKTLPGSPNEKITEGLDGLPARVAEYVELGARFAKWRAVINMGDHIPTPYCIEANAHALARYARICQEGGLVPIVEPEVMMEGDHDAAYCDWATHKTLHAVFNALFEQGVALEGMLLKPNMIVSGKDCATQADAAEVARRTLACLQRTVPAAMPGNVFLSGGMTDEVATENLDAMNRLPGPKPWKLSYSYGRALQHAALNRWAGDDGNAASAQHALICRAKFNSLAAQGQYSADMEQELQAA